MTLGFKLPEFMNVPPKLLEVVKRFDEFAYFLLDGGRGGGKSQFFCRFLLYLGEKYPLRICAGRETMNSIEESIYTLLKDLIADHNLNYDVQKTKITHRASGTTFIFKGFREQGLVSIKGLEGVDVLIIDEAQALSQPVLDVIIPTIRKEKSKVLFAMNRWKKKDPVYIEFKDRPDCLHIKINYDENPFCPKKLLHEAAESKAKGEDGEYRHIWLGYPVDDIDNFLYTSAELEDTKHFEFYHKEALYGRRIGAFDIARMGSDRCAFVVIEQKGPMQWEEIYTELWKKKDLAHTTGRIIDRIGKFKLDISIVDGDGMGSGPRDIADFFLNSPMSIVEWRAQHKAPDTKDAKTGQKKITERHRDIKSWAAHQVKDMIDNGWLKINHEKILDDMEAILYDFTPGGVRFIVGKEDAKSREKMRLMGITSPDAWSALIMAVSEIRNTNKISDTKISNLPAYTIQDDDAMMGQKMMQGLPQYTEGM